MNKTSEYKNRDHDDLNGWEHYKIIEYNPQALYQKQMNPIWSKIDQYCSSIDNVSNLSMVPGPVSIVPVKMLIQRNKEEFDKDKIDSLNEVIIESIIVPVKGISNYLIYTIQKEHQLMNG